MNKPPEHIEGVYPFLPVKPEHEVLRHLPFMTVIDEQTGEERQTLDYRHGATDIPLGQ